VCAPHVPVEDGWGATLLLWTGPPGATPPACPTWLPTPDPGFADTAPSVTCPACTCSPTIDAQCHLPYQVTAISPACPGGAKAQPFGPPSNWDGMCTAMDAVSSADAVTVIPGDLHSGF